MEFHLARNRQRRHLAVAAAMALSPAVSALAQQAPATSPQAGAVVAPVQMAPAQTSAGPAAVPLQQGPLPGNPPQGTPPVAPNIQPVPLPAAVEYPAPPVPPSDVPNRPLTADEAALIALHDAPAIAIARAGIQVAQGQTQQVASALKPNVGVGASYGATQIVTGTSASQSFAVNGSTTPLSDSVVTFPGSNAAVDLRQLLFDFNHTRDQVKQARLQERVATANLSKSQSDLVFQVKQAYYTYVQNARLVTVEEADVANRQNQLSLAQARLNVGLGLPSDVVSAQTNLAQSAIALEQARNNASTARIALALSLGVDARTPIQVGDGDELPVVTNDVNALVATAEVQRPDVLAALANVQSGQYNVKAARTNNAPVVSGTVGVASHANGVPGQDNQLGVGVQLSWDPFDGGLTKGIVKEARGNLTIAQMQLSSVQLSVVSDVAQSYVSLRTAEQRLPTANAEVANAEEDVRIAEGRYREGIGTFVDVTTAQALLVGAQTDRAAAIASIDTARASLAHAIGAPLPVGP